MSPTQPVLEPLTGRTQRACYLFVEDPGQKALQKLSCRSLSPDELSSLVEQSFLSNMKISTYEARISLSQIVIHWEEKYIHLKQRLDEDWNC